MKTAVVVGNSKPKSRTLDADMVVVRKLTGGEPDQVFDLIEFGRRGLIGKTRISKRQ